MANELLQAVQGTPFDLKTLDTSFAAVADRLAKNRQLDIMADKANQDAALKLAGLDLREQGLALRTQEAAVSAKGQELLNQIRAGQIQKANYALQDASDYNDAIADATVDGKPLAFRLKSNDPAEAEAAYRTFAQIRDRFRASPSPIVNQDLKQLESLPFVQAKQNLAAEKETNRATATARRLDQGDRRLDLGENILDETVRHHGVTEDLGAEKVKTGQENAETRRMSAENRGAGKGSQLGITVANGKFLTYDQIRRTLGRGSLPNATETEKTDAETLRQQVSSLTDPVSMEQRFGAKTLDAFTQQGVNLLKADATKPAATTPATKPSRVVEPDLPSQDGASNTADPTLTPVNPPASNVDSFLKKYGIPRKKSASVDDSGMSDDIMGATQKFLVQQGLVPAVNAQALGLDALLGS